MSVTISNNLPFICVPSFARHLNSRTSDDIKTEYKRLKENNKPPTFFERRTISDYIFSGLLGVGVISGLYGLLKEAKGFIFTGIMSAFIGIGSFVYGYMNGVEFSREEKGDDVTKSVSAGGAVADVMSVESSKSEVNVDIATVESSEPSKSEVKSSEIVIDFSPKVTMPTATNTVYATDPITTNVEHEFAAKLKEIDTVRLLSEDISTADFMKQNLPMPKYKIKLNGSTYFLSEPFKDENWGRPSFNLYLVKKNYSGKETIYARGVYKSNSQAIWRVASHTTHYLDWIGKGLGEETTNIPLEIQPKLEKVLENYNWNLSNNDELAKVLARLSDDPPKTFYIPNHVELGEFSAKNDPSSFKYADENNAPDFNQIVDIFKSKSDTYGEIKSYIVESKDRKFKYLFNVASDGKKPMVWIGGIEYSYNEINTYGVNLKAVRVGKELLMPAYEYLKQIPKSYVGNFHPVDDAYCNATNFTHKLPPVKEFIEKVLTLAV